MINLSIIILQSSLMGCDQNKTAQEPLPNSQKYRQLANINHNQSNLEVQEDNDQPQNEFFFSLPQHLHIKAYAPLYTQTQTKKKKQDKELQLIKEVDEYENMLKQQSKQSMNAPIIQDQQQLLKNVLQEIKNNKLYHQIVDSSYVVSFFEDMSQYYKSRQQRREIIDTMFEYMIKSGDKLGSQQQSLGFVERFGKKMFRMNNLIQTGNRNTMKIIQSLCPGQNTSKFSYLNLRFKLDKEQLKTIIDIVKNLIRYDERVFCLITNYLQISAAKLESLRVSVVEINDRLGECFQVLEQSVEVCSILEENNQLKQKQINFKQKSYEQQFISLKQVDKQKKVQTIEDYIIKKGQLIDNEDKSIQILLQDYFKYGQRYSISKFKPTTWNMLKAKQQIIDLAIEVEELQDAYSTNNQLTLASFSEWEQLKYNEQLIEVFSFIDSQIQFKIWDMVQLVCFFSSITKLNGFVEALTAKLQQNKFVLHQVENNLLAEKGFPEVVLRIKINSSNIQLKLRLLEELSLHLYNQNIHELVYNRIFSFYTHLKLVNQPLSIDYLRQICNMIKFNILVNKKERDKFQSYDKFFNQFIRLLPYQVDTQRFSKNWVEEKKSKLYQICRQNQRQTRSTFDDSNKLERNIAFKKAIGQIRQAASIQLILEKSSQNTELLELQAKIQKGEYLSNSQLGRFKKCAERIKRSALNLLQKEVFDKAIKKFEQYIRLVTLVNEKGMIEDGKLWIGKCEHRRGNFNKALDIFSNCIIALQKQNRNKVQLVPYYISIANVYYDQQIFTQALNLYQQCLAWCLQANQNDAEVISMYGEIGKCYESLQQYQTSLEYYGKGLRIQECETGKDSYQCICILLKIGRVQKAVKLNDRALQKYLRCLKIIQLQEIDQIEKLKLQKIQILTYLSELYNSMKNYEKALIYAFDILWLEEFDKQRLEYSQALRRIAEINQKKVNIPEALKYYKQCLESEQKLHGKDHSNNLETIKKIAKIYQKLKNRGLSLKYSDMIKKIEQRHTDNSNIDHANTFINIASKCFLRGNYPQSIKYYNKSLKILQAMKVKKDKQIITILQSKAEVYKVQRKYEQSLNTFYDCLQMIDKTKGKNHFQSAQIIKNIAHIYEMRKQYKQAKTFYQTAIHICEKSNVKYMAYARSFEGLGNIYFNEDNFSKAFECFEKCLPMLEKLESEDYKAVINKMNKCDEHIQQLFSKEKDIKENQLANENQHTQY